MKTTQPISFHPQGVQHLLRVLHRGGALLQPREGQRLRLPEERQRGFWSERELLDGPFQPGGGEHLDLFL